MSIDVATEAYDIYYQLTEKPKAGHMVIGKGEAASIALAKQYDGIVASNNLKDISLYIAQMDLKHLSTRRYITCGTGKRIHHRSTGNTIWTKMLSKRRKLGAANFTAYIQAKQK